jgi:N6-adenosine-specific RNA methylase IME4
MEDIYELPVAQIAKTRAHLYLWVPNALVAEGLETMKRWGFTYKTHLIWYKIRKDGGPDRRGVGFYFRNVTEMLLFGVRGKGCRTLKPGRTMANIMVARKRGHSIKPDEQFDIIESCSWAPFLELFSRRPRHGWHQWGDEYVSVSAEQIREMQAVHVTRVKRTYATETPLLTFAASPR